MNYTEQYEVRTINADHPIEVVIGVFSDEHTATEHMNLVAHGSGTWRVVRVSEVTVASVARA